MRDEQLKTETRVFKVSNEQRAMEIIEEHKNAQGSEGYTLIKYNTTYKSKKDRKTGEIIDEFWLVSVTKEYEVF